MAGRRLRDAMKTVLTEGGNRGEFSVVIAGLTNTYSQYIATFEEYQVQRYKGASTLYGPHTLSGYIQEFKKLAHDLISSQATEAGPQPPDLLHKRISLVTPVVVDMTPIGTAFGDIISDIPQFSKFRKGIDIVTERPFKLSTLSSATIEWRNPETASLGVYRITHFGCAKTPLNSTHHFAGSSSAFVVQ